MRDGTCRPEELGWYEGMTDWRPLGELFPDERPAPGTVPPMPPPPPPFMCVTEAAEPEYTNNRQHNEAWGIDYLILMVPFTAISLIMGLGTAMATLLSRFENDQTGAITAYAAAVQPITFVLLVIGFAYYVFFESSKWQATPGKMAVGIRVTDVEGRRLTIARAAGRNAVRLVNAFTVLIPMVFYITAAFTQRKQGVHDLLAGTYVLTGRADSTATAPAAHHRPGGRIDA